MANELRELVERLIDESRAKAEKFGYNLDAEYVSECKTLDEAYALGRFEQLVSILDEVPEG